MAIDLSAQAVDEISYWKENALADGANDDPILRANDWAMERLSIASLDLDFTPLETRWSNVRQQDERDRYRQITAWVGECGGFDQAFMVSPPIVLRTQGGRLDLVDGWHRIRLAHLAGLSEVWCAVGKIAAGG